MKVICDDKHDYQHEQGLFGLFNSSLPAISSFRFQPLFWFDFFSSSVKVATAMNATFSTSWTAANLWVLSGLLPGLPLPLLPIISVWNIPRAIITARGL